MVNELRFIHSLLKICQLSSIDSVSIGKTAFSINISPSACGFSLLRSIESFEKTLRYLWLFYIMTKVGLGWEELFLYGELENQLGKLFTKRLTYNLSSHKLQNYFPFPSHFLLSSFPWFSFASTPYSLIPPFNPLSSL